MMHFETVDHPPIILDSPWSQTRTRWEKEGLPKGIDLYEYFNLEPFCSYGFANGGFLPPFKERFVKREGEYDIWVDHRGVKVRALRNQPYLGRACQYLEYPIKGREDIPWLEKRLDPEEPARIAGNWRQGASDFYEKGVGNIVLGYGSYYGFLREEMGTENLSLKFYDDPDFIHWVNSKISDICVSIYRKVFPCAYVTLMGGHEDMACKKGSMISMALFREFMLPYYKKTVSYAKRYGQDVFGMDSDGNIQEIIPLWLEVGINLFYPMEVAAGMDALEERQKYGRKILMMGNIDKRVLAKTKADIKEEVVRKVPPLVRDGGYIPTIDHAIPDDVPLENYAYYVSLLKDIYSM